MSITINKGIIAGRIVFAEQLQKKLPKLIWLLDAQMKEIKVIWIDNTKFTIEDIDPGIYLIRLELTNGKEYVKMQEVASGVHSNLVFRVGRLRRPPSVTLNRHGIARYMPPFVKSS